MKLSKQQEEGIMQVYNAYCDNYLKGDVEAMHPLLDDHYTQVGSAESEVFSTKKDAVQFLYDTIDQVSGKLEMRNRIIKLEQQDNIILIHERCDLYALADEEWIFYSKFRVSTLMQEKKDGWKLIHQHSSFPDARTDEGQNVAIDKIAEENIQLREAVKRRTIELEQKNKDLLIEVALEKVRSRTMAMHKSDELAETTEVLHQQLLDLGIYADRTIIAFPDETSGVAEFWSTNQGGIKIDHKFKADLTEPLQGTKTLAGWKKKLKSIVIQLEGEELSGFLNYYNEKVGLPFSGQITTTTKRYYTSAYFSHGWITLVTAEPLSNEKLNTLERFAAVFNLTYTRFLDLQKAEAQTRESQIELGLERVRARAMAMQNSEKLKELISTVFAELTKLDLALTRCLIMIYDPKTNGSTWWMANSEAPTDSIGLFVQYHEQPPYLAYIKAWQQRNIKWQYILEGTVKKQWDDFLFIETELSDLPDFIIAGMKAPDRVYLNASFNNFGNLTLASLEPLSNEHFDILLRFAKVFDLTYTRFNDLKQAEAQAKEARIEAALEKVRSCSLSMHHSDELKEVITVVLKKLQELGIEMDKRSAVIFIFEEGSKDYIQWVASPGHASSVSLRTPYFDHPIQTDLWNEREEGNDFFAKAYSLQEKNSLFQHFFEHTDLRHLPKDEKNWILDNEHYALAVAFEKNSALAVATFSGILLTVSESEILKRFACVFEQAYTRFQDLQKAEAQAREATIEASLERVRARAMAMHDSKDVGNAIGVLFSELDELGIVTLRCGILIIEETNKTVEVLTATSTKEGKVGQLSGKFDMTIHPLLEGLFNAWKQQQSFYTYELSGHDLLDYFKAISKDAPEYVLPFQNISIEKQSSNAFFFNEGALFTFTSDPLSAETSSILQRFTAVFGLTYRRYLDLKVAEEQTRQAVKQASLDRVRAEIASMRSSEHLQQITPLVWRELITLNVTFERCGVFIINEVSATVQAYLSTPDGRSLGLLDLSINDNELILKAVEHWRMGQVYKGHWDKEQFADWIKSMIDKGQIPNRESYIGDENPPSPLYLHFVPFTQGMLYVGNTSPLTEDEIGLVKSLAEAFEIAYARYEDFKKLEDAKNKVELTLSDLRSAQKQLIQSEKMASLGELTAGIAHEIQNPLNFVNNFSEVSMELIEEVKSEKLKAKSERSEELENELLEDISQNLQKISHHGKRADFIVKGMLQHSRTSRGEKQATNINTLADEFLKLSYHGLRAKDKSFNAELKTNFDKNLPKINVVQQDIGRVLLNLFNNAFYAVQEKRKSETCLPVRQDLKQKEGYKPAVEVSTSAKDGFVIIIVKDNGIGIPEGIKDKIMQPFFTTKPTGEGTGLGLSLSYDIIKAHGGNIQVETKEGEGSEFIIQLPVK